MATSPTQLTKAALEKMGAAVAIVEKHNCFVGPPEKRCPSCGKNRVGIKQDLFGVFDILAVLGPNTLAIQTTSGTVKGGGGGHHSHRRRKVLAEPRVRQCLQAGWLVEIWSWHQPGGKGTSWVCRKEAVVLSDLEANHGA